MVFINGHTGSDVGDPSFVIALESPLKFFFTGGPSIRCGHLVFHERKVSFLEVEHLFGFYPREGAFAQVLLHDFNRQNDQ